MGVGSDCEAVQHVPDLGLRAPRSQFLYEFGMTSCLLAPLREKREAVVDVVLHQHQCTARFPQRVKIRHQRPVRIPGVVVRYAAGRGLKKRCCYGLEGEFCRPSRRRDTHVFPAGRISVHDGEGQSHPRRYKTVGTA